MSDSISGRGPSSDIVDFADLRIDAGRRIVSRGKTEIPLPKLSFDLLLTLLQHAPNVVSIDDFMQQVWPGLVVSPETVSQRVKLLRDALGDDPHNAK
jgi:DNA-binding winged helix-turn-helix (wHTH) protein